MAKRKFTVHTDRINKVASTGISLVKDLRPKDQDALYFGDEPNYAENQNTSVIDALNWYNHFYSHSDCKNFLVSYLEKHSVNDVKYIKKLPEVRINTSMGFIARMMLRGFKCPDDMKQRFDVYVKNTVDLIKGLEKATTEKEEKVVDRRNIQEVMRERAGDASAEIEAIFDKFFTNGYQKNADFKDCIINEFQSRNVLPQHVSQIVKNWEIIRDEYQELQKGKNDQLNEGYSHMSKSQIKNAINFCENVIDSLNNYVSMKQAVKKVRIRKPIPVEKVVRKLKYLKSFTDTQNKIELVSLSPTKLHNASEAWVYDTSKRKMHHFVADEYGKTLSVKGNTIIGFDKKLSGVKTLRKPNEQLKAMIGSKPAARKYFDDIKAVHTVPNGRFNSDMIILKAW
jgi:hypothetical protein